MNDSKKTANTKNVPVSVIVPCYNCSSTIERAICSITSQSKLPSELFLVNDASDDDGATSEKLSEIKKLYSNHLDIYIIELDKNVGPAKSRNIAWDKAKHKYIAFLDADDTWHPKKIEIQYSWMKKNKEYALSSHKYTLKNFKNIKSFHEIFSKDITLNNILFSNPFSTPNIMLRKNIRERFSEDKRFAEDYDLWTRIISSGKNAALLDIKLSKLYKAPFGQSGLSSYLWQMEKGEINIFKDLFNKKIISLPYYFSLTTLSLLKFLKRALIRSIGFNYIASSSKIDNKDNELYEYGANKPSILFLWALFFCFSTFSAIIFQKFFLPMFPELHAGFGLLSHDSILFHELASNLSFRASQEGWSLNIFWSDAPHMRGHVAILAILYSLFSPEPSLIIPVNAALHASAATMIILIANKIDDDRRVTWIAGITAASLFLILPSALNWYAQVHRDGYVILGTLIILYSWVRLLKNNDSYNDLIIFVILNLLGIFLYWFVRPYYLILIAIASTVCVIFVLLNKKVRVEISLKAIFPTIFIYIIFLLFANQARLDLSNSTNALANMYAQSNEFIDWDCPKWKWTKNEYLPSFVDESLELGGRTRSVLLCGNYEANSNIDVEIVPSNAIDLIKYLPRGIQISLLAPFPNSWLDLNKGAIWFVGVAEIILIYIFLPGFFWALLGKKRSFEKLFIVVFAFMFLAFFGYTISNLGTLHRLRYVFLILIILISCIGWISYIRTRKKSTKKHFLSKSKEVMSENFPVDYGQLITERNKIISGGFSVAALTALSYIVFFMRDILMVYYYGFGPELDMFFIALLIPMFFVNTISIPFGEVTIPEYLEKIKKSNFDVKSYVKNHIFIIMTWLLIISMILITFSSEIVGIFTLGFSSDAKEKTLFLFYTALPILALSGLVVIGNSILNAHSKYNLSASYQLFPALLSIIFLFLYGSKFGVLAVLVGMIIGQVLNYICISYHLLKQNILLIPVKKNINTENKNKFLYQFATLSFVTLFFQIIILINNSMASNLGYGSISSLNIGLKFLFFITGIVAAVMSMVILPYFSSMYVVNKLVTARNELIRFVILATSISMCVCICMFFLSGHIINIIFDSNIISMNNVENITNIIKLGLIQIPFFTCLMLLIKFCIAFKINKEILLSSIVAVISNIILNTYFIGIMGISGIALSTSLSISLATFMLMFLIQKRVNIILTEILFIFSLWVFFIIIMLCLYNSYYAGVIVASIAMGINSISLYREYLLKDKVFSVRQNI